MSQAPRNSSTTRKSSSLCSLVGFRVGFRIWQGLQMTKMPNHLLNISYIYCHKLSQNSDKYNVFVVYLLNIFKIDIWTLVQSLLMKKTHNMYWCIRCLPTQYLVKNASTCSKTSCPWNPSQLKMIILRAPPPQKNPQTRQTLSHLLSAQHQIT